MTRSGDPNDGRPLRKLHSHAKQCITDVQTICRALAFPGQCQKSIAIAKKLIVPNGNRLVSMITLSDSDLIGIGGRRRLVYAHPNDPGRCIKVPKPGKNGQLQQQREVKFYGWLQKQEIPTKYLSRYLGTVNTNLGVGYMYEAVRDADGSISERLKEFILNGHGQESDYLRIMETLEDFLFDNQILFYDLGPSNILCRRNESGSLDPVIIDGLGDVVAIPILNFSSRLKRRKIRRRWLRLIAYMNRKHDWMKAYRMRH